MTRIGPASARNAVVSPNASTSGPGNKKPDRPAAYAIHVCHWSAIQELAFWLGDFRRPFFRVHSK